MSQNNHLIRVWMPVSFIEQRWDGEGGEETKYKGPLFCKLGEDVLMSSFLQSFTGGTGKDVPCDLNKGTLA